MEYDECDGLGFLVRMDYGAPTISPPNDHLGGLGGLLLVDHQAVMRGQDKIS